MIGLALKVLGVGLAGSTITYGAYLGISEDMKGKASTDYPAYYGNKNYRTVYSGLKPHSNVMLKYGEEEKGKFLYNYKKLSFGGKKAKGESAGEVASSNVTADDIKKVKEKLNSDSDAINTLLKDVDSNGESRKDENRFKSLSEEGKKYRELCIVMLREYVMNNKGDKNVLDDKCLFDSSTQTQFEFFKSNFDYYISLSTDTDYLEKITSWKENQYKKRK